MLGVACCRYVRGLSNHTCVQLLFPFNLPFFRDFVFAFHQVLFLRILLVLHFLLDNVPRFHLRLQCPLGSFQTICSTMYVIASHLKFNYWGPAHMISYPHSDS